MVDIEVTVKLELEPLVLTREQVAKLLQISEDSIDSLHRTKQLMAVKWGNTAGGDSRMSRTTSKTWNPAQMLNAQ